MYEYRCYKCGAESTNEYSFKYNGKIIETRHFCDECLMNLIISMMQIATDFDVEIEEDNV